MIEEKEMEEKFVVDSPMDRKQVKRMQKWGNVVKF